MDLALYLRVLWRFRVIVAAGTLLAVTLALLSFVRVELGFPPSVEYRSHEQWAARSTLLVSERNFPQGRSVFPERVIPADPTKPRTITPDFAPSSRFTELAAIYAQLVPSDAVRRIIRRDGPFRGTIEAAALTTPNTGNPLPLLMIGGISTSPEAAAELAHRATEAFSEYLATEQRRSGIPANERVVLSEVRGPAQIELLQGRSKTLPIVVFLTVMLAVVGLAFVLENLRPRIRPLVSEPPAGRPAVRARRSA